MLCLALNPPKVVTIIDTEVQITSLAENLDWVRAVEKLMETEAYGGFFISSHDVILCSYEFLCIHEVGHWKDKHLGYPSKTVEFESVLDDFILQCEEVGDNGEDSYYCNLTRFPGINGNELDRGWGGYPEAYAEIYVYDMALNHPLPEVFIEFYK